MSKKHSATDSFGYAFSGIKNSIKDEPNLRFHILAGTVAIFMGFYFQLSLEKMAILVITIFSVIILELVNTVVEEIVNIIRPHYSPKAKLIKDISAAIVLLSSFAAIAVGLLLFAPYILQLLSSVTL